MINQSRLRTLHKGGDQNWHESRERSYRLDLLSRRVKPRARHSKDGLSTRMLGPSLVER
jgi:hypothetical protein